MNPTDQTRPADSREPEETDGRRRRSLDSRARIVAAMLDLVRAGHVSPSAEQVAARAGVGLRSVFRHFNDMDSLYAEMSQATEAELFAVIEQPFKAQDWRKRVMEMIGRRGRAYDRISPYKRASNVHRHGSAFLEGEHRRLVTGARALLEQELPADLKADGLIFEALELMLSYEAWTRLRDEQGLSPAEAEAVLRKAIEGVLGPTR